MECRSEWHTRSPHSHSPSWTEIFQWICLHKDSVGRNGKSQQWIVNGFEGIWYSYNGVHWYESIGWCYIAFTVCLMLYWNRNCELTHYLTGSLFPFCPSRILYFNKPALMYIKFQSVNLGFFVGRILGLTYLAHLKANFLSLNVFKFLCVHHSVILLYIQNSIGPEGRFLIFLSYSS